MRRVRRSPAFDAAAGPGMLSSDVSVAPRSHGNAARKPGAAAPTAVRFTTAPAGTSVADAPGSTSPSTSS
jgi:hypothetical protein